MILYEIAYWVGIVGVLAGAGGVVIAIGLILRGAQRDNEQEEEGMVRAGERSWGAIPKNDTSLL